MAKLSNKIIIVGLGNPGRKYKKTRHNAGFMVIDTLKNKISNKDIILFKPQTYMNNSGKAVKKQIENWKLKIENLYVIHDDIDLPLGKIRISKNRSSAGHKGVQSIIDELGTKNFTRIRIGINPGHKVDTEKFVLEKFTKEEKRVLKKVIEKTIETIKTMLDLRCPT